MSQDGCVGIGVASDVVVDVQIASAGIDIPTADEFQSWVQRALAGRRAHGEVVIRVVDDAESADLNQRYRAKAGPTNVLSFVFEAPPGVLVDLLGDLVICAPVVVREAVQQNKAPQAHWAHMAVHGTLHLLGYDHQEPGEAQRMECAEIEILARLGFPDPYQCTDDV